MATILVPGKKSMWSREAFSKAVARHTYIKVDPSEKPGELRLSGAPRRWTENPNTFYAPSFRMVGTPESIANTLLVWEPTMTRDQINAVIADAYTRDNYDTTLKARFDQEVSAQKTYQDAQKKIIIPRYSLADLPNIAQARSLARAGKVTTAKAAVPGISPRVKPLAQKLSSLPVGDTLDVSNLTRDGKGVRTIKAGKTLGARIIVDPLPIASSTLGGYQIAIEMLGPQYSQFLEPFRIKIATPAIPVVAGIQFRPAQVVPIPPTAAPFQPIAPIPTPSATAPLVPGFAPGLGPRVITVAQPTLTTSTVAAPPVPGFAPGLAPRISTIAQPTLAIPTPSVAAPSVVAPTSPPIRPLQPAVPGAGLPQLRQLQTIVPPGGVQVIPTLGQISPTRVSPTLPVVSPTSVQQPTPLPTQRTTPPGSPVQLRSPSLALPRISSPPSSPVRSPTVAQTI